MNERRPRFAVFFALFVVVLLGFEALFYGVLFPSGAVKTYLAFQATCAGWGLQVAGWDVAVEGVHIRSREFSVAVQRGCDGLQPLGILIAGILALPVAWRRRVLSSLAALAFVLVLNWLRVMSLCWVAARWPSRFDLIHLDIWQPVFLVAILSFWLLLALRLLPPRERSTLSEAAT